MRGVSGAISNRYDISPVHLASGRERQGCHLKLPVREWEQIYGKTAVTGWDERGYDDNGVEGKGRQVFHTRVGT